MRISFLSLHELGSSLFSLSSPADFAASITAPLCAACWSVHGGIGENGALQRLLEENGVPFTGERKEYSVMLQHPSPSWQSVPAARSSCDGRRDRVEVVWSDHLSAQRSGRAATLADPKAGLSLT